MKVFLLIQTIIVGIPLYSYKSNITDSKSLTIKYAIKLYCLFNNKSKLLLCGNQGKFLLTIFDKHRAIDALIN